MRVLTNRLDKELAKLLKNRRVSKVDIATAWATESGALDALEEHKKRPESKLVVRPSLDTPETTPRPTRSRGWRNSAKFGWLRARTVCSTLSSSSSAES